MKVLYLRGFLYPKYKLYKHHSIIYRALLSAILLFVSCLALAQEVTVQNVPPVAKASSVDNETEITPLKIGDKIPDELWDMYFPVVSTASDKEQYLSLGDFKDKLIILDFWATWCAPCITSFPKLMDLQSEFKDDIFILPITREKSSKILSFFKKFEKNYALDFVLPTVVGNTILHEKFPHKAIPHYIIIKNGLVQAITDGKEINKESVQTILNDKPFHLKSKVDDLSFDHNKALFVNGNGGNGSEIEFRSTLSGPIEGVGRISSGLNPKSKRLFSRIISTNSTIEQLFKMAYHEYSSFSKSRTVFDIKDALIKNKIKDRFTYELIMPEAPVLAFKDKMIEDLSQYFGLNAFVADREMDCWVLYSKDNIIDIYSKGGEPQNNLFLEMPNGRSMQNQEIQSLRSFLDSQLQLPVIDETKEKNKIDINIPNDLDDIENLKRILDKQGLELLKETRTINVLVISEHKNRI